MNHDLTAPLASMDVKGRMDRVRELFDGHGCDSFLVTNLVNVRYLTGFTGSAALLAITAESATLTTDGRYKFQSVEEVSASGADVDVVVGGLADQKAAVIKSLSASESIALEAANIVWGQQRKFAEDWFNSVELIPTNGLVEELRRIKDEGEIARIRRACHIADTALETVYSELGSGISEQEFALILDMEMRRLGAEKNSFETIVAAGTNGAKAHHRPSEKLIEPGEFVVVDFGCEVEGYCSDTTRTFSVGEPSKPEQKKMYEVVLAAQLAGVDSVAPDVTCGSVDDACRDLISEFGWAAEFLHSTGHGVGLDVHEEPWVAAKQDFILQSGNIITVEPGVYLGDIGGVRIEDTIAVTDGGCEPLSEFPKDLITV